MSGVRGYAPRVRFEPQVEEYFAASFGAARLAVISAALARPSLRPALRVNTLQTSPQDAVEQLRELLPPSARPRVHPRVPAVVTLQGRGPLEVQYGEGLPEVVVNRFAGEAVLKGAHVYAPGVLAASPGIAAGDRVAVSVAIERPLLSSSSGARRRQPRRKQAEERREQVAEEGAGGREGDAEPAQGRVEGPSGGEDDATQASGDRGGAALGDGGGRGGTKWAVGINRGAQVGPGGEVPLVGLLGQRQMGRHHDSRSTVPAAAPASTVPAAAPASTTAPLSDSSDSRGASTPTGTGSSHAAASTSGRADRVYVGVGVAGLGRRAMFRAQEGVALRMEQRVFDVPSCNGVLRGQVMLQALPSIVAAQVLAPPPGSTVLDMCAAPGGKTTLLAQLMGDTGRVVALDRTVNKVREIQSLASDLGVRCVEVHKADATQAVEGAAGPADASGQGVEEDGSDDVADGGRRLGVLPAEACGADGVAAADAPQAVWRGGEGETAHSHASSSAAGGSSAGGVSCAPASACNSRPQPEGGIASGVSKTSSGATGRTAAAAAPPSLSGVHPLLGPPPYPPGTFTHVLLDPPCSALGLRPRLLHSWTLPQLRALAAYQRALLHTAVALLAPGGELVYCTCTINPDENEANVAWALDRFKGQLLLLPAEPRVGARGLTGRDPLNGARWLTPEEAALVQRFDPGLRGGEESVAGTGGSSTGVPGSGGAAGGAEGGGGVAECDGAHGRRRRADAEDGGEDAAEDDDCMGFFIARFRKVA